MKNCIIDFVYIGQEKKIKRYRTCPVKGHNMRAIIVLTTKKLQKKMNKKN